MTVCCTWSLLESAALQAVTMLVTWSAVLCGPIVTVDKALSEPEAIPEQACWASKLARTTYHTNFEQRFCYLNDISSTSGARRFEQIGIRGESEVHVQCFTVNQAYNALPRGLYTPSIKGAPLRRRRAV
eukprot:6199014-Pleurochrysis_carterae.AAC.1